MAKIKESERLRAPLMYAFRSAAEAGDAKKVLDIREGGERVIATRRALSNTRRSLSDSALRELLTLDLVNLLNTTNLESAAPDLLDGLNKVKASILNYGLPDLSSRTIDENRVTDIRLEIEEALRRFEPRLLPRTMQVLHDKIGKEELRVRFVVRADMRADPVPTSVEFVTEVEFDTGQIKIGRLGGPE